jgi:hypothetical protein
LPCKKSFELLSESNEKCLFLFSRTQPRSPDEVPVPHNADVFENNFFQQFKSIEDFKENWLHRPASSLEQIIKNLKHY